MSEKSTDFGAQDGFDAARAKILKSALARAAFEGWTSMMLAAAARDAGIEPAVSKAAFPRGVQDVLRYWSQQNDAAMLRAMQSPMFAGLKIREKVAFAVRARLDALRPHKEAARRAAALMALPTSGLTAPRLAWATADAIWCGLDDKSY